MRPVFVFALSLALLAALPALARAALVGSGFGAHVLSVGDWVTFQSDAAADRSCPSKAYALTLTSLNEEGTTYFTLNCTLPVNQYHAHPPFFWYNNSIELYQYAATNDFLGINVKPSNPDFHAQTVTLNLEPFTPTPTPTAEPTNFTRYCADPSTAEGTCSFNYKYCRPGTLDFVCDCQQCPVPEGAISPCTDICHPPTPTPTETPLATLPAASSTPALTASATPLPSAVTGQPTPAVSDNSGFYWMAGGVILLILLGLTLLSQNGKPPKPVALPHPQNPHAHHPNAG